MSRLRLLAVPAVLGLLLPTVLPVEPARAEAPEGTEVRLLSINDFHGRVNDDGQALAHTVEGQRAENANTALLGNGDSIGASLYASSSQQDQPTLDYLNALGLQASSVGNHEFDQGFADLTDRVAPATDFDYLGANVYERGTTEPALPEYSVVQAGEVNVAVIGVVTEETPSLVSPDGIEDIEFGDPTEAVNRVAAEIEALPEDERPDMTVVTSHVGASDTTDLEAGKASSAEFAGLVEDADPSIDAILGGHTHQAYSWEAPIGDTGRTRPVIQTGQYAQNLGAVTLTSEGNGDWDAQAPELLPTEGVTSPSTPVTEETQRIIDEATERANEIGSEVAGTITEDIPRATDSSGGEDRGAESTLGNLVADALKDATATTQLEDADLGITNPGGLRDDLLCSDQFGDEAECEVTAAELNAVLPFANTHGVVTLKGSDLKNLFEEQWQPAGSSRPFLHLGVSDGVNVVYDSENPAGERVVEVTLDGSPVEDDEDYRVATLSFLAAGGDNFSSFANGTYEESGLTDFEAWEDYFAANDPVSPDKNERQADAALDVIDTGDLQASVVTGEDEGSFALEFDAATDIKGPLTFTADGVDVDWGDAATDDPAVARVDGIAEGTSSVPFTVESDAQATSLRALAAQDFTITLRADPEGPWWDDNPLPLARQIDVDTEPSPSPSEPGPSERPTDGPGDDDGGNDGGGNDDGGNDDDGNGGGDGSGPGGDGSGPGDDRDNNGGDLPRTGSDVMAPVALAIALLIAGVIALVIARRQAPRH